MERLGYPKKKHVPKTIINLIRQLNQTASTHILVNNSLREEIQTPTGIPQRDSLSPQLLNLIMDEIVNHVNNTEGGNSLTKVEIKIVCYADDPGPLYTIRCKLALENNTI